MNTAKGVLLVVAYMVGLAGLAYTLIIGLMYSAQIGGFLLFMACLFFPPLSLVIGALYLLGVI